VSHNKLARRLTRLENRQRREATALKAELRRLEVWLTPTTTVYDVEPIRFIKPYQSKSFGNGEAVPEMTTDELLRRLG
jgi:hypothetical protein